VDDKDITVFQRSYEHHVTKFRIHWIIKVQKKT